MGRFRVKNEPMAPRWRVLRGLFHCESIRHWQQKTI